MFRRVFVSPFAKCVRPAFPLVRTILAPFPARAPLICFPVFKDVVKRVVVVIITVKDEFKHEFDIPDNLVIPPGATIDCKVVGKPKVAHALEPVDTEGGKTKFKLVILVQAIVKIIVRDASGRVVAAFLAVVERRIETFVFLPFGAVLVVKDVLVDCGPCRLVHGKIVCQIKIRVIFKVVGGTAFDP